MDPFAWRDGTDLARDRWAVAAQWGPRPADDVPGCARRLDDLLSGLAAIDPALNNWDANSGETITAGDRPALERVVDAGWDREVLGGKLGAAVELAVDVRPHTADELERVDLVARAGLSVSCGGVRRSAPNGLDLRLPRQFVRPELYRRETLLALCDAVVGAWQPTWCSVAPSCLVEATREPYTVDVLGSWAVYLEHGCHTRSAGLPSEIEVRPAPGGQGDYLLLAPVAEQVRLDTVQRLRRAVTFSAEWDKLR